MFCGNRRWRNSGGSAGSRSRDGNPGPSLVAEFLDLEHAPAAPYPVRISTRSRDGNPGPSLVAEFLDLEHARCHSLRNANLLVPLLMLAYYSPCNTHIDLLPSHNIHLCQVF